MIRPHTMRAHFPSLLLFLALATPILGSMTGSAAHAQGYQFQYDANGNTTRITDPLGNITDQSFDPLNRLKQQLQPSPAAGVARPTIGYDYNGQDRLTTVTDPRNLVTGYTVDGLGNQTTLSSPDTGVTNKVYDIAGDLKTSTDARGQTTTYTYDVLHRPTRIDYADGTATVFG